MTRLGIAIAILVAAFILLAPIIYFRLMDCWYYEKPQKMKQITFALSSDVENIKMVTRLHELLGSYYTDGELETFTEEEINVTIVEEGEVPVATSTDFAQIAILQKFCQEMKLFDELHMLDAFSQKNKKKENAGYTILLEQRGQLQKYRYQSKENEAVIYYDKENSKVIKLEWKGEIPKQLDSEQVKQLQEDYIAYMHLDLVDDWYYNGQNMVSEKAHLAVTWKQNEKGLSLGYSVER